jgi:hypothetical protein
VVVEAAVKEGTRKGQGRPLFGVNAVVYSKKKKSDKKCQKKTKTGLDRADIVRDYRLAFTGT